MFEPDDDYTDCYDNEEDDGDEDEENSYNYGKF